MKCWLSISLLLCSATSWSQLSTSGQTPSSLVQNTLLGTGVTVSNINYSGVSGSIGYFDGSNTNLGISTGIVMTTGTINNNGAGPHGPNNNSGAGVDNGAGGYSGLSNLIGGIPTFNAAILEFDFIPYSDTVRFKYVFGSEEYPEFVGSNYNDVFAFFISGPGIPGGTQNIAKLPNGSAVAINNVNNGPLNAGPCVNCAYYINNGVGNNGPYNSNPYYIQYDGFTKVLQAVSKVQCGQTYHLVIAIADAGDGNWDSGIFLEANSLTSPVPVQVDYALSYDAFGDGKTMAEGCVSTTVTVTRSGNINLPLTIPVTVAGTATEIADYTDIPASVTFAPGQSSVQFTFDALNEFVTEGTETLDITVHLNDACGNPTPYVINLNINDIQPVAVTVESPDVLCPGEPVELFANATGGVGPYTYQWSTGETTASIFVSPASTQTYSVTVVDNCLHQSATDSGTVVVPVYTPVTIVPSPDVVEICPFVPTDLSVDASGGSGSYFYTWSNFGNVIGTDSVVNVAPPGTTTYEIIVTDQCGDSAEAVINYTVTSPPLTLELSPETTVCPNQPTPITVTASGGYGQYYYVWTHSNETTATVMVNPGSSAEYTVIVSDECQTFTVSGTTRVNVSRPYADFRISSQIQFEDLPITFLNQSQGAVSYQWIFGDGQSSTDVHPNNTYADPGNYQVMLIAINEIGCLDTTIRTISVDEEYWIYVPNTFTPDHNRFNQQFAASTINISELEIVIFNRWGQVVYSSSDVHFNWDGTCDGELCKEGTYNYRIEYVTTSGIKETILGHVNLLR